MSNSQSDDGALPHSSHSDGPVTRSQVKRSLFDLDKNIVTNEPFTEQMQDNSNNTVDSEAEQITIDHTIAMDAVSKEDLIKIIQDKELALTSLQTQYERQQVAFRKVHNDKQKLVDELASVHSRDSSPEIEILNTNNNRKNKGIGKRSKSVNNESDNDTEIQFDFRTPRKRARSQQRSHFSDSNQENTNITEQTSQSAENQINAECTQPSYSTQINESFTQPRPLDDNSLLRELIAETKKT